MRRLGRSLAAFIFSSRCNRDHSTTPRYPSLLLIPTLPQTKHQREPKTRADCIIRASLYSTTSPVAKS